MVPTGGPNSDDDSETNGDGRGGDNSDGENNDGADEHKNDNDADDDGCLDSVNSCFKNR